MSDPGLAAADENGGGIVSLIRPCAKAPHFLDQAFDTGVGLQKVRDQPVRAILLIPIASVMPWV